MFYLTKSKWIIQDNELRMGRVVSHSDLCRMDGGDVKGGGLWYHETETNTLYLYNKSHDFGQATEDDFENIWVQHSLEKPTIYFSKQMDLENAKKINVIVQDFDEENDNAN